MHTHRSHLNLLLAALIGGVALTASGSALASPTPFGGTATSDDRPSPMEEKRRGARAQALEEIINGAPVYGKTHEVANGQFVELERQSEDAIWTVLGEFGELPFFGGSTPGPLHNEIAEPNRDLDNTTYWEADFDQTHYQNMLFSGEPGANSMRNYYIEQSSGRYAVHGMVEDWVEVPYDAATYGRDWCGDTVCPTTTWWFIEDTVNGWYQKQLDAGMTPEEIDDYLAQYDHWDRYDYDGDGDFDEPDGYIDHFQAIHAGEGQEAGGGAQGSDAIWSHRWYVQLTPLYTGGPVLPDGTQVPFGGVQIGNSRFWIGDYTIEPENGGVGVFAHEFAHDLGLPDLYDTAGGDNSTAFWTIMSAGSWMGAGQQDIGTAPVHMGAWEKFQLGWLNYEVGYAATHSTHKLGPAETNTKQAQALFVVLPDKLESLYLGTPYEGDQFYYSGSGDGLDNYMTRMFDVEPGSTMTAWVNYDIETDWDYAYAVAIDPNTGDIVSLPTDRSSPDNPYGQNFGYGITDTSSGWVPLAIDLSGLSAGSWYLGFEYWTDGAVVYPGFMVDNIEVTGYDVDGAEVDTGWDLAGFRVTTGSENIHHFNAYVAEYRQHVSYDDGLRTGPYNFGFLDDQERGYTWVEHFPYQEGLLVSYWDTTQSNNNTSQHPGAGLILPIDAHPEALLRADGVPERTRIQAYDSTFGLEDTDAITLHYMGVPMTHPSLPAASVFDDNNSYWNPDTPLAGVQNPHTDTRIWINSISAQGSFMQLQVN